MPHRMSGLRVCAVLFLHDHHDDPPDSALALRFLGAVHRSFCRKKRRNLLLVIPRRAAIAIVVTSGPGFAVLSNITKQCYAN